MSVKPITEDDLQAFVDGVLDDSRRTEVSIYLDAHPEVASRIQNYIGQRRALHAALDPVAGEPVPSQLNLARMIESRRRRTFPAWGSAVAAMLLLFVGGSGGWMLRGNYRPPMEGMMALAHEASDSYSVYATDNMRPVELRADDMTQLVDWATQRLGHKPVMPDLTKSGYRLMGGRIIATPHGAGLMLMYDDDRGTRLVMLSRPMNTGQDMPMLEHSEGDVAGWTWASDGMGYSVVGPMAKEALHPLANDIRRQT